MKLTIPRLGLDEIEVDEASLIKFPNGLPGFEDCQQFKLFHSGNNPSIFWLLSIDDPDVVFSIAGPESIGVVYNMTLSDDELSTLQIQENDELQVAVILAWQDANGVSEKKTLQTNLESPIVINVSRQLALQKMLHFSDAGTIADDGTSASDHEMAPQMHTMAPKVNHPAFAQA